MFWEVMRGKLPTVLRFSKPCGSSHRTPCAQGQWLDVPNALQLGMVKSKDPEILEVSTLKLIHF